MCESEFNFEIRFWLNIIALEIISKSYFLFTLTVIGKNELFISGMDAGCT